MSEEGTRAAAGGVGDPRLDTLRTTLHLEARKTRWRRKSALWELSSIPRCRNCGRARLPGAPAVGVRLRDGHAGLAGLQTCGSVWACPTCSVKIGARRAAEIGTVVAAAMAAGKSVGFITLTMRHHRKQSLSMLWDALASSWASVTGGKGWLIDQARNGVEGWVRTVEVTTGANGWHVHVHALVVCDPRLDLDRLGVSMWRRWRGALVRRGLDAPLIEASDWRLVNGDWSGTKLGEYLSKGVNGAGSIGRELTMSQGKVARSRHSTRQVMELVDQFIATGETSALARWHEWEKASKGRRQIAWSRGLRERYGVGIEIADEELAAAELGTVDDTVCWIEAAGWSSLIKRPWLIPELLNVLEVEGWASLLEWLNVNGVSYRPVGV